MIDMIFRSMASGFHISSAPRVLGAKKVPNYCLRARKSDKPDFAWLGLVGPAIRLALD